MPQSLLIKGPFTETDLKLLMMTLRSIERRSPSETFTMIILDDDISMADAEGAIKRIFPRIDGDEPTVYVAHAIDVICPDGQTRHMRPDLPKGFPPDIDQPQAIMMRGVVEIDADIVQGTAWLRHGKFYFEPD